jgi:hypothetical protein
MTLLSTADFSDLGLDMSREKGRMNIFPRREGALILAFATHYKVPQLIMVPGP